MKRSLTLAGHRTSVTLEEPFWEALKAIAARQGLSLNALVSRIDAERATAARPDTLSSTLRVFVLRAAQGREA